MAVSYLFQILMLFELNQQKQKITVVFLAQNNFYTNQLP